MPLGCGGRAELAYTAKVIEVMIASPGDVPRERAIVREVLYDWNDLHASDRNVVFLPVGWDTHSAPDLAGPPQDIINERVLKRCDVLVGIFWTRIGSPTGKSVSGSVEEIEEHLKLNKPVMLYFSQVPVQQGSVDQKQFDALQEFKAWAMQRGIVRPYQDHSDFRDQLRRDIAINLRDNPHLKVLAQPDARGDTLEAHGVVRDLPSDRYKLSTEAKVLLIAAAEGDGTIIVSRYMSGFAVQAARTSLFSGKDRRAFSRWEAAVEELNGRDLVRDKAGRGEVFFVTDAGYRYAEALPKGAET